MGWHQQTNGILSVENSAKLGGHTEAFAVSTSTLIKGPVARNVFVIEPADKKIKVSYPVALFNVLCVSVRFVCRLLPPPPPPPPPLPPPIPLTHGSATDLSLNQMGEPVLFGQNFRLRLNSVLQSDPPLYLFSQGKTPFCFSKMTRNCEVRLSTAFSCVNVSLFSVCVFVTLFVPLPDFFHLISLGSVRFSNCTECIKCIDMLRW